MTICNMISHCAKLVQKEEEDEGGTVIIESVRVCAHMWVWPWCVCVCVDVGIIFCYLASSLMGVFISPPPSSPSLSLSTA